MDRKTLIHDLSIVYAQERLHEFFQSTGPSDHHGADVFEELTTFYTTAYRELKKLSDKDLGVH